MHDKKLNNIYDVLIEDGFSKEVAMLYVVFRTIGSTNDLKSTDFKDFKSFNDEVRIKAAVFTTWYDQKDVDIAFILYAYCTYDWEIDAALCGSNLGGKNSKRRTFRELYNNVIVGNNLTTE